MLLIQEIQSALRDIEGSLMSKGPGCATNNIHDAFEAIALRYANEKGISFGTHETGFSGSKHPGSLQTLYVRREHPKVAVFKGVTEGVFLFDHSWLIFYNHNSRHLKQEETGECLEGYMIRCELVMESELSYEGEPGSWQMENFHHDFRKLVVAKAPYKIFIFKSPNKVAGCETLKRLKMQILCTEPDEAETYLLSCWHEGSFMHQPVEWVERTRNPSIT